MKSVYLETTIPSYLAAKPSGDLVTAAHQKITHDWWEKRRADFALFVSQAVVREARRGDPDAAQRRLGFLQDVTRLRVSTKAIQLAKAFQSSIRILRNAEADSIHLAVATLNRLDYVLTWNCRHLANGEVQSAADALVVQSSLKIPQMRTPEELLYGDD